MHTSEIGYNCKNYRRKELQICNNQNDSLVTHESTTLYIWIQDRLQNFHESLVFSLFMKIWIDIAKIDHINYFTHQDTTPSNHRKKPEIMYFK